MSSAIWQSIRMRIAQIAPLIERVPPRKYGGVERVVYELTEELVRREHDVTLFASGDSITSAKLVSVYPNPLREVRIRGMSEWSLFNIGIAYSRQNDFDIIHDHNGFLSLPTANIAVTPVVMTLHGPFTINNRHIYGQLQKPYLVTISKAQAVVPNLHYVGTVYNGLTMDHYPFSSEPENYLLFVGRISWEKGVHYAIQVAQETHHPLIIAAKLEEIDRPYFDSYVAPFLSDRIRWIGEVDEEERNKLMSKALAFLHPITWREPFGLTLIEAMACGCPVIAFRLGSIPEIIADRKTGFIIDSVDEMIDAVQTVSQIDRNACRRHALDHFNGKRMTNDYEEIYRKVLNHEI